MKAKWILAAALAVAQLAVPALAQTPFTIAVFQSEGYLPDFIVKDKGFGK